MTNGIVSRFKNGLKKTREGISGLLDKITPGSNRLDEETKEQLEETLINADVGVNTTQEILNKLEEKAENAESRNFDIKLLLRDAIMEIIDAPAILPEAPSAKQPQIMLVVGINGVGKTTSTGKIAYRLKNNGFNPLICAADTFRAAAVDQLEIWAERADVEIVRHKNGKNPAAVVYDAISAAKSRGNDWIVVDTAGRLHTKKNLMNEVEKIKRVAEKNLEGAPHEIMLIVDATTGQNGLSQAKSFAEYLPVTGLFLTKLDGTAKGGVVISIVKELNIPLKYIGVGENIDDIVDFEPEPFIEALLGI